MRQGLAYAYGALVEPLNEEQRTDVDAILDGRTPPSQIPAPPSSDEDWRLHVALTGGEVG